MQEHDSSTAQKLEQFKTRKIAFVTGAIGNEAVAVAPAQSMDVPLMNELLGICGTEVNVALSPTRADAFILSAMNAERGLSRSNERSSFECISVEAREGITTGISAADRAKTVALLGEETPQARKLIRPGHIFPVKVREGGALVRNDLPEGAYDIVRLSFRQDAATYLTLLNSAGEHPSELELQELAEKYDVPLFTLTEIIKYRLRNEQLVSRVAKAKLPTKHGGELTSYMYQSLLYPGEHIALVKGKISEDEPVLTRVQPEFTFGDVFGGDTPNSRGKIQHALNQLEGADSGVFVYLRRSDTGELEQQVKNWQKAVKRPAAAMMQEYGIGAQILRDLGVTKIELLTTKRQTISGLEAFGLEITSQKIMQ